jgi:hypothetical protein
MRNREQRYFEFIRYSGMHQALIKDLPYVLYALIQLGGSAACPDAVPTALLYLSIAYSSLWVVVAFAMKKTHNKGPITALFSIAPSNGAKWAADEQEDLGGASWTPPTLQDGDPASSPELASEQYSSGNIYDDVDDEEEEEEAAAVEGMGQQQQQPRGSVFAGETGPKPSRLVALEAQPTVSAYTGDPTAL